MAERRNPEELTEEELEETNGEKLPDREAMSLIGAEPFLGPVAPIDPDPGLISLDDPPPGT